jgi:RHS repeat-associated protein
MGQAGTLATANLYRFSSKELHYKSGMYYYGFRFYDPHLQRWVNRDPMLEAGGLNLYAHCGNTPLNVIDPNGQEPITIGIGIGAGAGAGAIGGVATGGIALWGACWTWVGCEIGDATGLHDWLGDQIAKGYVVCMSKEHTKNARPSTTGKHEEGEARKKIDAGGEKGDARRDPKDPPPRGPKPPRPPYPPNKGPKPKKLSALPAGNRGGGFVLFVASGNADWEDLQRSISDLWAKAQTPSILG